MLLIVACLLCAEPEIVERYKSQMLSQRNAMKPELEVRLKNLRNEIREQRPAKSDNGKRHLKRLRDEEMHLENLLDNVSKEMPFKTSLDPYHLDNGKLGTLQRVKMLQILGPDECLVIDSSGNFGPIYIKGMKTDSVQENHGYEFGTIFEVTGNRTYANALGVSKTVKVLTPRPELDDWVNAELGRYASGQKKPADKPVRQPIKSDPSKMKESKAKAKIVLLRKIRRTEPDKAKHLAEEIIELAPDSDAAKEAKQILERL